MEKLETDEKNVEVLDPPYVDISLMLAFPPGDLVPPLQIPSPYLRETTEKGANDDSNNRPSLCAHPRRLAGPGFRALDYANRVPVSEAKTVSGRPSEATGRRTENRDTPIVATHSRRYDALSGAALSARTTCSRSLHADTFEVRHSSLET